MAQTARSKSKSVKSRRKSGRAPKKTGSPSVALIKPDIVPREPLAVSVSQVIENTLIIGDLKSLTSEQRVEYAKAFAKSLGINILTRPFDYILFREYDGGPERLELYLNAKGCAQLRKIHRISTVPGTLKQEFLNDHCITRVDVRDGWGGTDTATGSVTLWKVKNGQRIELVGREWDNAVMKCETKAKRRATLSICGLAMLDESQLDTMQIIGGVTPEGRVYHFQEEAAPDRQLDETAAHGHPEGSERAKQAESNLQASQEVDRIFEALVKQGKPANEETAMLADKMYRGGYKAPQTTSAGPSSGQDSPSAGSPTVKTDPAVPKAKPVPSLQFKGTIEIDCTVEPPIVRGDLANITEALSHAFPSFQWGADSWWHVAPADVASLTEALAKNGYKVEAKWPAKSSAGKKVPAMTPTPPAEAAGSGAGSGRDQSAAPASLVVHGMMEKCMAGMSGGKTPVRDVTLLLADKTKPSYRCWDKSLFEHLDAGLGKACSLVLKKNKTYWNIVGLRRIGSREWLEDGTPAVQNRDREAGAQKTLY